MSCLMHTKKAAEPVTIIHATRMAPSLHARRLTGKRATNLRCAVGDVPCGAKGHAAIPTAAYNLGQWLLMWALYVPHVLTNAHLEEDIRV